MTKARPAWMTKRTDRPTYGGLVGRTSKLMGWTLTPFQQEIVDIANEYDPGTGQHVYDTIIFTGPRQTGKTTVSLPWATQRCLFHGQDQRVFCTMQDRNHMTNKLVNDHFPIFERSELVEGHHYRLRRSNGSEAVHFPITNSSISVASIGEEAGHGNFVDMVNIDEAFAHRSTSIDLAFHPAMQARTMPPHHGPQMLIFSTRHSEKSYYLEDKIRRGRAAVEAGKTEGIFYCEYSAPEDSDIYDDEVLLANHPGIGHLTTLKFVQQARDKMRPEDFACAYLNIPMRAQRQERAIDPAQWEAMLFGRSQITGQVALAVDRTPDGARSVIAAAGFNDDGNPHVEIIDNRDGEYWVIDRLEEIRRRHGTNHIALDPSTSAGGWIPRLENNQWKIKKISGQGLCQACASLTDVANAGQLRHIGQDDLTAAVDNAMRSSDKELWVFHAIEPDVSLSPLYAVALALNLCYLLKEEEPDDEPSVYETRGFIDLDKM